jgi:hypothetical protein
MSYYPEDNVKIHYSLIILMIITFLPYAPAQNQQKKYTLIAREIVSTALITEKGYHLLDQLCRIWPRLSGCSGRP